MYSDNYKLKEKLHTAIENENVEEIRSLVTARADITRTGPGVFNGPAIFVALEKNKPRALRALLEAKADVHQRYSADVAWTPLFYLAHDKGYMIECANVLIEAKADLEPQGNFGHAILAQVASPSRWGATYHQLMQVLIAAGANLEQKDESGSTPLQVAATHINAEGVQLLCEAKADVGAQDAKGHAPLHLSISNPHYHNDDNRWRTWRLLQRYGADSSTCQLSDEQRRSYLDFSTRIKKQCSQEKNALKIILDSLLISDLINMVASYWLGEGDLMLPSVLLSSSLNDQLYNACHAGDANKAKALIELKADVHSRRSRDTNIPLYGAILGGMIRYGDAGTHTILPVLKVLLEAKADVNSLRSDEGEIPLNQIIKTDGLKNKVDCVQALIEAKADVNREHINPITGQRHGTPLYCAVHWSKDRLEVLSGFRDWRTEPSVIWPLYLLLVNAGADARTVPVSWKQEDSLNAFFYNQYVQEEVVVRDALEKEGLVIRDLVSLILSYRYPGLPFSAYSFASNEDKAQPDSKHQADSTGSSQVNASNSNNLRAPLLGNRLEVEEASESSDNEDDSSSCGCFSGCFGWFKK